MQTRSSDKFTIATSHAANTNLESVYDLFHHELLLK